MIPFPEELHLKFIIPIVLLLIIVILAYIRLNSLYQYWKLRNVPYLKPNLFLGNAQDLVFGRKSILEYQKHMYEEAKWRKLLGTYMFQKPTLYITDLDWIKNVLTRDWDYFYDRGLNFDTQSEPLTQHLFHLEGEEWKVARNKVMPAFTLNGILVLLPLLVESAVNLKHYLRSMSDRQTDLDLKTIMSSYAAEVIGKCAFGLKRGPLTGDNVKFYKMSKKIFAPRMRTIIKLILPKLPNFVTELLDIKMIETEVSDYFCGIIEKEIKFRQENNARPNDFLGFMIDLRDKDRRNCSDIMPITDRLIMAHCFMFFIAGYENTTGVLCAALFELARNTQVQEKLYLEIGNHCPDENEDITFKSISEMKYLDMVVNEVLRLYPPATALIRECTKDYNLPQTDITLEKGLQVVIPVSAINTDPRYYPYSDHFNPENFADEAKRARSRCTFLPFGDGPRACIGRKFGIIQIKVALIVLVLNYQFFPSPKMKLPITFDKQTFITSIEGGAWVRCTERCR